MKHLAVCAVAIVAAIASVAATAAPAEWAAVDQAMGRKGAEQPGGLYKYSFPRSDLRVTLDGVRIKPALALGGWVASGPTRMRKSWRRGFAPRSIT